MMYTPKSLVQTRRQMLQTQNFFGIDCSTLSWKVCNVLSHIFFEVYCLYNFTERSNVSLVFSKPLAKIEITCPKEIHLFFPVFDCFGIFFYVYIEIWVLFHQWWLNVQGNNSCNLPIFRWLFFGIEYVLIKWKNISDIFAILKQQKVISKGTDK